MGALVALADWPLICPSSNDHAEEWQQELQTFQRNPIKDRLTHFILSKKKFHTRNKSFLEELFYFVMMLFFRTKTGTRLMHQVLAGAELYINWPNAGVRHSYVVNSLDSRKLRVSSTRIKSEPGTWPLPISKKFIHHLENSSCLTAHSLISHTGCELWDPSLCAFTPC